MKKFYFLLVALCVGLAANAAATQLYLIGEPAGGWSPLKGLAMDQTSDGVFEIDVTLPGTQWFGFSQKLGNNASDWSTMNGARYGAPSNNYQPALDQVVNLRFPSENSFQVGKGDYHFIVDTNANTFVMTGQEVEDPTANVLYLRGDALGWDATEANKMTADGNTYTISVAELRGQFKIANHDYSQQFSANSPIALDTPTALANLGTVNSTLADGTITDAVITFVKTDKTSGTVTITGTVAGGGEDPVIDYTSWYVNIVGPFNSWGDNGIAASAEGLTTHTSLAIGTQGFKVKVWNGADIYYVTDGTAIVPGEWTQLYQDAYDAQPSMIEDAAENSVYDVEYNCATNQVKVTLVSSGEEPEPTPDYTTWFVNVFGPFNSWTDNGVSPNEEGISLTEELAIGTQGFKVKTWDGSADKYYVADGDPIAVDEWVQLHLDTTSADPIQIADATENSVYNVEFNCATNQVKVTLLQGEDPEPAEGYLDATYDFPAIAGTYTDEADWTADGSTDNVYVNFSGKVLDSNGFTLVTTKGASTDARLYKTSKGVVNYHVYNGGTLTLSAPDKYYLTKVEFYTTVANSTSKLNSLPDADGWTKTAIDPLPEGMKVGLVYEGSTTAPTSTLTLALTANSRISKIQAYAAAIWLGVESVVVTDDENAPVEYYNLQGVRVDNPEAGLYIRRQGNTITKVLVK